MLLALVGLTALLTLHVSCQDGPQSPELTASTAEAITSAACASGVAGDVFPGAMAGCNGAVTWANRATLCAAGYRPATAAEWQFGGGVPTHDYWTNDNLEFGGTAGSCFASYSQGSACPAGQPMRVCSASGTDAEGNQCNWTNCGMEASAPNAYFGGCSGNTTAGTLCVPTGGCANGAPAQVFGNGVVGCAASVSFANAATLCAPGYAPATHTAWENARGATAPTYNYWLSDDDGIPGGLPYYSGSGSGSCKAYGTSDFCGASCNACPSGQPMHVCTASGTDAKGNSCTWTNCAGAVGSTNQYYGGCSGVENAGTLCAPREGCAGGLVAQHFTVGSASTVLGFEACAGTVSWANASTLCMPGYQVATAAQWAASEGSAAPTNNYWTSDNLLWSGTSTACSVSTTTGSACTAGQPMHVCTPTGTDPEGNGCTWANCGLNTTTPDAYFGGCSGASNATAGALCVLPKPRAGVAPITGYVGATFSGTLGSQLVNVPNVSVWARNMSSGVLTGPVTTNPQGYFRTPNLPSDISFQICVSGAGYLPTCDSQSIVFSSGSSGLALNHTVAITPTPKAVWGTVRLQDATPCFWFNPAYSSVAVTAQVTLVDSLNNVVAGPVSGNSLGQYVLPASVTGSYTVKATCELASGSAAVSLSSSSLQQDLVVTNSGPQITSLDLTSGGVGVRTASPGTVLTATVTATDPNSDTLHYNWTDDSGRTLGLPDAPSVSWTLPSNAGYQNLRVQVSDTKGGYAATQRSLLTGSGSLPFSGTVIDGWTSLPVANATVTLTGGAAPVTTDANGVFQLSVPDAPRFVLNVTKVGYALTSYIYYGRTSNQRIPLYQALFTTINAGTGGTATFVNIDHGINLTAVFPPNVLVDQFNNPYTGTAVIEGFQYDIKKPGPIPGDQGGTTSGGATARLVTFGAFHITPRDTLGNPLQMASGGSVSVTMGIDPVAQSSAPASIPLWLYDEPSGMWLQHSTMTLTGSGTTYTGNVLHFSAFNADTITTSGSSCVKVILDTTAGIGFTLPVLLSGQYTDPSVNFFHHNLSSAAENPIGIERLAPNVNFTLSVIDPKTMLTLKSVTLNSGPPLNVTSYPTGIVTDPNFDACNGPYTIYNSTVPTGPTYLMPITGGAIQDNSALYYGATHVTPVGSNRATVGGWFMQNGFPDASDAHATYFNNGDLKFGREMHCHQFGGRTSCYVNNYGAVGQDDSIDALSDARNSAHLQATVCMEYDPSAATGQNVQFWAYQTDGTAFTGKAAPAINGPQLDGQGSKPMPDMCQACHGGSYNPNGSTTAVATGAFFLPFDLDSFLYDTAGDPHVGIGTNTVAVQEQFRKLNAFVLATTASNAATATSYGNLMTLWYGSASGVNTPNTLFQFNTSGVNLQPSGSWSATNTVVYDNVVKKACRTCHIARSASGDAWTTFAQMNTDPILPGYACGTGNAATHATYNFAMPHAEVPFKLFWNSSLGSTLAAQLTGLSFPGGTCSNQ